ncbi:DsbA family protein [Sporolactobacillus shoreae]|uniref:DsbA family protein n=1 Tax=Sporolactobacillus shoreae TaxID=1465501 RepID=A0A4Z0GNG3_9BACL|nr:thioredoxin domain-containing protein [Sporolactobacillus shoreae]TGA97864.1 DsbA family protein [Sporolactobacillus shoreae]
MSGNKRKTSQTNNDRETSKSRGRIVIFSSAIIILLIAAIAVMIFRDQQKNEAVPVKKPATHRTEQVTQINYDGQPFIGSTNAPVKIAEFADYRCPYCKAFEENIMPQLERDYIKTNKANFYFINYTILGPGSVLAANASEEVFHQNPKGFWAFHQALYKAQGSEQKEWVTKTLLTDIARKTVPSLDVKAFQNSLDTESHKQAIESDNEMAESLDVPGTPAVFVNGKYIEGSQDYSVLKQAIDQALKKQ